MLCMHGSGRRGTKERDWEILGGVSVAYQCRGVLEFLKGLRSGGKWSLVNLTRFPGVLVQFAEGAEIFGEPV